MVVVPLARGLHLCERVVVEDKRNLTLKNVFRTLRADRFPAHAGPFVVHALLVNGEGEMPFQLAVVRLDRDEPVYSSQGRFTFPGRMHEVRFNLSVTNCIVPVAGSYAVLLWANGELLAQTDFRILPKSEAR